MAFIAALIATEKLLPGRRWRTAVSRSCSRCSASRSRSPPRTSRPHPPRFTRSRSGDGGDGDGGRGTETQMEGGWRERGRGDGRRSDGRSLGPVGPGPLEREVLAGASRPAPLEAKRVNLVLTRSRVGRNLARAHLGARGVMDLHRDLGARRAGERLGAAPRLPGNLDAPAAEIVGELELDRAYSIPRTSSINSAKPAGQPPASPPQIVCSASRWGSSARSSMKKPMVEFLASPVQMFPSNEPTATTLRSSSDTSP